MTALPKDDPPVYEANPPLPPRPQPEFAPPPVSPEPAATAKPSMRDRLHQWSVRMGVPVNRLTNKLGSEAFWPSSLDHECDKAARILKSFCRDGFYTDQSADAGAPGPKGKPGKALVKIPTDVIRSAAGLAIFTTFRTGLHVSGAGGSGVLISRLSDGGWSPPSGFLVHTLGAGFLIGFDIYDCVCVLRTPEAVKSFTRPRVSLGGEVGLMTGPVGAGSSVEAALAKEKVSPIFSYMKGRGFYAGVQADGTVIISRPDANAAFYRQRGISVEQIISGRVPPPTAQALEPAMPGQAPLPPWNVATRNLMEVLKAAEGRQDVDQGVLHEVGGVPTPGDLGVADEKK